MILFTKTRESILRGVQNALVSRWSCTKFQGYDTPETRVLAFQNLDEYGDEYITTPQQIKCKTS